MRTCVLLVAVLLSSASVSFGYDPPKGLHWGMSYDEMKSTLGELSREQKLKVGKLGDPSRKNAVFFYPDKESLEGFQVANIHKAKFLDRKTEKGYAVFHPAQGLILVQFEFFFNSGRDEKDWGDCWAYFQKLREGLKAKYGDPVSDEASEPALGSMMPVGVSYATVWTDSASGDEITAIISYREFKAAILRVRKWNVYLQYASELWRTKSREEALDTDL